MPDNVDVSYNKVRLFGHEDSEHFAVCLDPLVHDLHIEIWKAFHTKKTEAVAARRVPETSKKRTRQTSLIKHQTRYYFFPGNLPLRNGRLIPWH